MRYLTEDATLRCKHQLGRVGVLGTQGLVTIGGRKVLVEHDPQGRPIVACPMIGPTIKPCTLTLTVSAGYSDLVRVEGKRVCLDTVAGLTDGTPPGVVEYAVHDAGQDFVSETG